MSGRRLRLLAVAILAVGLGSAAGIYLAADARPGYEREESKQYLRAMELYGGTANVLAGEAMEWFRSLWHGPRLAATVACVTVLAAAVTWFLSLASRECPGSD